MANNPLEQVTNSFRDRGMELLQNGAWAMLTGATLLFQWFLTTTFTRLGNGDLLGLGFDRLLLIFCAIYSLCPFILCAQAFAELPRVSWSKVLLLLSLVCLSGLLVEVWLSIGPYVVLLGFLLVGGWQVVSVYREYLHKQPGIIPTGIRYWIPKAERWRGRVGLTVLPLLCGLGAFTGLQLQSKPKDTARLFRSCNTTWIASLDGVVKGIMNETVTGTSYRNDLELEELKDSYCIYSQAADSLPTQSFARAGTWSRATTIRNAILFDEPIGLSSPFAAASVRYPVAWGEWRLSREYSTQHESCVRAAASYDSLWNLKQQPSTRLPVSTDKQSIDRLSKLNKRLSAARIETERECDAYFSSRATEESILRNATIARLQMLSSDLKNGWTNRLNDMRKAMLYFYVLGIAILIGSLIGTPSGFKRRRLRHKMACLVLGIFMVPLVQGFRESDAPLSDPNFLFDAPQFSVVSTAEVVDSTRHLRNSNEEQLKENAAMMRILIAHDSTIRDLSSAVREMSTAQLKLDTLVRATIK